MHINYDFLSLGELYMKILRTDLKRALISKEMLLSIILGLLLILLAIIFEPIRSAFNTYFSTSKDLDIEIKKQLIGNSLNKVTLWNFGNYFYSNLIPLICCIPFTTEYLKDKKNGFNKYLIIRSNYKSYIRSKIITTFISGFVPLFIISIITLIFINIFNSGDEFRSIFYYNTLLSDLSTNNFNTFALIYGVISSFMGGTYALIGLAISTFSDKIFVAFISPFFLYYTGTYIMSILEITPLIPNLITYFYRYQSCKFSYIVMQLLILFSLSLLIFLKKTYWSKIYE